MIQRIQSLYLLLSALILIPVYSKVLAKLQISEDLFVNFYHNRMVGSNTEIYDKISTWPVTVLLTLIIVITLTALFQFKNRIRQIRLCVFNIILQFGLIGLIYFYTKYTLHKSGGIQSVFMWPVLLPFITIVLTYLAIKKIQRDELLVRSADRIR